VSNASADATSGSPATDYAVELLSALIDAGVREIVLSPGSRSQALALVAADLERAGRVRLRVRIDERSAAFLALGLAVETGSPTAVITTSGTAVANLHPAVLEAHHSGVPLVLLTADRPTELRGIGANQTTHQPGLFGRAVAFVRDVEAPVEGPVDVTAVRALAHEAVSAALGHRQAAGGVSYGDLPAPGPVQINVAFREPLSAPVVRLADARPEPVTRASPVSRLPLAVDSAPATLVVAGHAATDEAERVARALGAPLIAEVSSGSHFGPNLALGYRTLLGEHAFGGAVRRVVVFGHPTLTRQIPALLRRSDVEVVVVRGSSPEAYDPGRDARVVDAIDVPDDDRPHGRHQAEVVAGPAVGDGGADAPSADDRAHRAWVGRWVQAGRLVVGDDESAPDLESATSDEPSERAAFLRGEVALLRREVSRRALAETLWRVTWPHDRLVLGASRLIREVDEVVPGKRIPVHANRGLAGIDGTIATATGIAYATQLDEARPGVTRVLVGDLTLLHDVGSLLFGDGEVRPRLQVVVGNDGGGTIFDGLEVAASAPADAMTRVQFTPQSVDLSSLAAAYGWQYSRAGTRAELDRDLARRWDGPVLIEVPLAR
jgi:2-succinyl-5-enolpyruvyl-6-hydroxy-3-cyclohexene-1-carboxylate synthase